MTTRLAFVLDPKEHHDFGIGESAAQIMRHLHVQFSEVVGHQGRWTDERHVGAHFRQRMNVGAGDPAEEDVAKNHDFPAAQAAEMLLHRERIEQTLRRVLVRAVAGVDDRNVENP